MIILLGATALAAVFFMSSKTNTEESGLKKRLYDMPDIDPSLQGGNFKTDYDLLILANADATGVPFALLKAESAHESSLRPSAFLDENPKKLKERQGWASRGLLQLLWWPGSERFKRYGWPDEKLGVDAVRLFEPGVNLEIGAQFMRDNIHACKGNVRDTINMWNTGKKESQLKAPNGYVDKVVANYEKIIGRKI